MATYNSPTQTRSRRRRDALLRAALELIAEGGLRAVTHRAVARRAGLPPATTTYFFPTIQDLIHEALKLHVAERVETLVELSRQLAEQGATPGGLARGFAGFLVRRSPQAAIAQFELYLEGGRQPELLRASVVEALDAFEKMAHELMDTLGVSDAAAASEAIVAVVDGFLIHRVARPRPPEVEAAALYHAIEAVVVAYAMEPGERQRRLQGLADRQAHRASQ
jgi:DNA-binding transcriptional regulator YbjK